MLALASVLSPCLTPAWAQDYPSKPVRLLVPGAPGTVLETAARIIAPDMGKALGQAVVVESRPGAGGIIAYEHVIKQSPADGYTVILCASDLVTLPIFVKDLSFDPLRDLPPVSQVAEGVSVVFAPMTPAFGSYAEFIAYVKANPGKVNYGSAAFGQPRLTLELIRQKHDLDMQFVPYKGGSADTTRAILANEIQLSLHGEAVEPLTRERKVRALAIVGPQRLPNFPDVPTIAEVGVPEMPAGFAFTLHIRAGTSRPIIDRVHAATVAAVQTAEVKSQMAKFRIYPIGNTPEVALKRLTEQAAVFASVARRAGLQPQAQ